MSKPQPPAQQEQESEVNLSQALRNAQDAHELNNGLQRSVAEGIAGKAAPFRTHSNALAGRLIAEETALREVVADIDAKIAALQEERTDAMLAHSGVAHALQALQNGRD